MTPRAFRTPAQFRAWLSRNHSTATELLVCCYKTHAAARGMIYAQALDEALCFGWIDGVRRSLDADSFSIRFSPRKSRSIWSRVNVAHVERLTRAGRMTESGLAAFKARDELRTGVYSFERPAAALAPAFVKRFRANKAAWAWFQSQTPWYRRTSVHWVMSAKREETRKKRLDVLIGCSGEASRVPPLRRT
ncbi:MAG TPA: YdeI/OmpD-associated family protein [Gemmatimonadales bacterium]|nr:YdeI/OmpD-associated family protein [Gemmatimonadales bacterium]